MSTACSPAFSAGVIVASTKTNNSGHKNNHARVGDAADRYEMVDLDPSAGNNNNGSSNNAGKNTLVRFLENNFLAGIITTNNNNNHVERELEELSGRAVKIVSTVGKEETMGGFDICREYSYSGDEEDEQKTSNTTRGKRRSPAEEYLNHNDDDNDEPEQQPPVLMTYILGKTYHPVHGLHSRRDDESSLFWFTYRCDFPEIAPYNITSDAGWGCMLRSAQMLLAQALRYHYKSRGWKPVQLLTRRRQDPFVRSLLTWFADFPSATENVYSLHNMVAAGLAKYDKLPGEWYGPGTACYVVRDLVELHARHLANKKAQQQQQQQQQQKNNNNNNANNKYTQQQPPQQLMEDRPLFRVHVASQALVCRDEIENLMTRDSKARLEHARREKEKESQPQHPLDLAWEEELIESVDPVTWDTALLLFIPLRLGLKNFQEEYVQAVAHTFSLPQSVGVLGGRPRGARWFYGAVADGSRIFGLDPHTVQNAPRRRTARVNSKISSVVELSDDYLRSVHTTYPEIFSLQKMDPSIALAFYCRNREDMESVFANLAEWNKEHPDSPELFTVVDAAPDYSANVSSAMTDLLGGESHVNMSSSLLDGGEDDHSEDDEYVML